MKYLSSILFIAGTCIMAYHEALSTVSKHGTVDLISTWEWHFSQFGVVILFTASGGLIVWFSVVFDEYPANSEQWKMRISFRNFGWIAVWGLAPALIIYQFLYPWLCGVVK